VNGVMTKLATRRVATAGLTVLMAGAGLTGPALAATASGAVRDVISPARIDVVRSAVVVKERRHRPFGEMLFTGRNRALYYLPSGVCKGACLTVWPALLMPKGKTKPKGASCLGTARFGSHHRLQVTYHGHRLYTFVNDTAGSVNGNGFPPFKVAKVVRCR
jgi:predicted lipoprotein with Yx(FWY)xxD motif